MSFTFNEGEIPPIRYTDVLRFFTHIGRSGKCPTCPHHGHWNFHVDAEGPGYDENDPFMIFFTIPAEIPSSPAAERALKVIALECPRCGHLEFLQAAHIMRYLQQSKERPTNE